MNNQLIALSNIPKTLKSHSFQSNSCITVNSKLNIRFPINYFLDHCRSPLCTIRRIFKLSLSVDVLMQLLKKNNNTERIYIHMFYICMSIIISYYRCHFGDLFKPLSYELLQFDPFCNSKYYFCSCKMYLEPCQLRWSLFFFSR